MYVVSSPRGTFSRTTIEEAIKTLATMDKTSAEYKLFWDSFKKFQKGLVILDTQKLDLDKSKGLVVDDVTLIKDESMKDTN